MITGEIKNVYQDEVRGSIVVETEYKNGDEIIQTGNTRYDELSGTNEEIIVKAKEAVKIHCENLVRRIETNQIFRQAEMLKIQKDLTTPIIIDIKDALVGFKEEITEVEEVFKDKLIKVTTDSINTVTDVIKEIE